MALATDQVLLNREAASINIDYASDRWALQRTITLNGASFSARIEPDFTNGIVPLSDADIADDWDRAELDGSESWHVSNVAKSIRLRYVDLFAGCGGLSYGIEQSVRACGGVAQSAMAVDIDPAMLAIYEHNLKTDRLVVGDIRDCYLPTRAELGSVDLLIGGPPCQGHSHLNNRSRHSDHRNGLYLEMANFAIEYKVPLVAIENVPTVTRSHEGVVEEAQRMLEREGYTVITPVIDASKIGVPQTRKRHFMLASKQPVIDIDEVITACTTNRRSVEWAIRDVVTDETSFFDIPADLSLENRRRIKEMFARDLYDMPNELRPLCHRNGHTYKSVYGRLQWDEPAGTITTGFLTPGRGRFIHPSEQRTLTFHEGARLQTFPDTFKFVLPGITPTREKLATAIGNAVPPKLGFVIGLWALSALMPTPPTPNPQNHTSSRKSA